MIADSYTDNLIIHLSHHNGDDSANGRPADTHNSSDNRCQKTAIIDGFYLQRIYSRIIGDNESQLSHFHLVFEDNLVCTYDEIDKRYHARPIICGSPSIISIPSIIEGPARPKGYYFKQMLKDLLSISSKEIEMNLLVLLLAMTIHDLRKWPQDMSFRQSFFFLPMVTLSVQSIPVDYLTPTGKKN